MKIRWLSIVIVFVLAVSLLPQAPVAKAAPQSDYDRETPYVPGEVLVVFKEGQTSKAYAAQASALAGDVNAQVVSRYNNLALLSFDENADVPALASQISASGKVLYAQPNYLFWLPEADGQLTGSLGSASAGDYVLVTPAGQKITFTRDQLLSMRRLVKSGSRWVQSAAFPNEVTSNMPVSSGFQQINADVVWNNTAASPAVCVVDTGVDGSNKDLSGKVVNGYDFVNFDAVPNDDNGHGTHVAGIIVAKPNSGAATPIGVSNGRVVAVKSLHAQGWGTAFELAAGINFCVDKRATYNIKIINLSVASKTASKVVYDALKRARDANMLIVAAAGNDSSSQLSFPAAWAHPYVNQAGGWQESGSNNEISDATISVAASRQNPNPVRVWIDMDGDGEIDDNEDYTDQNCAAPFTNYGRTVTLVAPGSDIYSTTPSAYPFYRNYYEGLPASYGYLSGSSMAAAFTSGAAARYWSLHNATSNPIPNGAAVKQQFVDTGRDLTYAIWPIKDADWTNFKPQKGYNNDNFGEQPSPTPEDEDLIVKAPYCWPDASLNMVGDWIDPSVLSEYATNGGNPYGPEQDMSEARYLDLAAAMGRMLVMAGARDAISGGPLSGATIRILVDGVQRDAAVVSPSTPWVILVNVPVDRYYRGVNLPAAAGNVSLQVTRSGYTSGYQTYETTNLDALAASLPDSAAEKPSASGPYNIVSVPPNTFIRVVLDWTHPPETSATNYPFDQVYADLDLYLWLPVDAVNNTTANKTVRGVVGPGWLKTDPQGGAGYLPHYPTISADVLDPGSTDVYDWGRGSLIDPKSVTSAWTGRTWPYAQLDSDGGSPFLASGSAPVDTITMRMTSSYPYFAGKTYHILVTDYSRAYSGASFGGSVNPFDAFEPDEDIAFDSHLDKAGYPDYFTYPVVRVWYKGVVRPPIKLEDPRYSTDGNGCASDWWYVATMNNLTVAPKAAGASCGSADYTPGPPAAYGILPYPPLP